MKTLRTNFALRIAAVLLLLLGYTVLANHCALSAAVAGLHVAKCCETKQAQPCPEMPQGCCKLLKATLADAAKAPIATAPLDLLPAEWLLVLAEPKAEAPADFPHGPPPRAAAIVQILSSGSLHSQAPPVRA